MSSSAPKILLIESIRANGKSFSPALQKRYDVTVAYSGKQGVALAQAMLPDVVVLDAASMRTSGDRICRKLRACLPDTPIIHIRPEEDSNDPPGQADVVLHQPLTWRKLVNRIKRFVDAPQHEDELLWAGSRLCLNVGKRVLVVDGQEKRLTPKLSGLAEMFFKYQNTVIARKTLIQQVWKTEYMGDTRTLDVHIRWLREALEDDPGQPRVITTVRGVGYRFVTAGK